MGLYNTKNTFVGYTRSRTNLALFESVGIIGDSFSTGVMDVNGTLEMITNLSWPKILERSSNIDFYLYGRGGLTTKTWLTDSSGLSRMNSEIPNNLYVIALGINDANNNIPVGSLADIESDSVNSFYSYYGRIIRAIRNHAPNCIIMLSTLARFEDRYRPFSNAIKSIGTYYNYAVLDLSTDDYFTSDFFTDNQSLGHPTAIGYSAMSKAYRELIEKALDSKADDYSNYTG